MTGEECGWGGELLNRPPVRNYPSLLLLGFFLSSLQIVFNKKIYQRKLGDK